jgi:hypothetical protein
MATRISLGDKRAMAHDLYMRTDKTQKEIASITGIDSGTMGEWVKRGKWKELKAANSVTRARVINNTLLQIKELQDEINGRTDKRYPTPKEGDTMIKMSNLIRDLDKSLSLPDYITVFEELLKWLNEVKPQLARDLSPFVMEFAQVKARQISA